MRMQSTANVVVTGRTAIDGSAYQIQNGSNLNSVHTSAMLSGKTALFHPALGGENGGRGSLRVH